jgi:hypothetical protein
MKPGSRSALVSPHGVGQRWPIPDVRARVSSATKSGMLRSAADAELQLLRDASAAARLLCPVSVLRELISLLWGLP